MAFDRVSLTSHTFKDSQQAYTKRDTMLYALGLGVGATPTDAVQLRFVYEKNLVALPTMGVVLAHPGFWAGDPALGIDWVKMLHVGQGLTVHQPIPIEGNVIGRQRIAEVVDRGADKGALLYYERDVVDAASGQLIATVRQTLLCRGNGGFNSQPLEAPAPHAIPDRKPDHVIDSKILPQAALIYRLSGDMNPLHADPDVAAKAGFKAPILHGLATYGVAGYTALNAVLGGATERFHAFDVRFTSPVYPGETIRTELWQDGDVISLRSSVIERGKIALDNGRITIRKS
jgi:acyl dehydratase